MIISAQWELVRGDTYAYTSTSAFGQSLLSSTQSRLLYHFDYYLTQSQLGFFYGGFGGILTPFFGVRESYGDDIVQYNNAIGFFMISKLPHTLIIK